MSDQEKLASNNKPKKRSWWFYSICFGVGFFLSILLLVIGTTYSTFDSIWEQQGHHYDTKVEHFTAHFVGGARNRLLKNGSSIDSWPVRLMTWIERRAYVSAIKKIPENDFERVYWRYRTDFLLYASSDLKTFEANKDELLQEMSDIIANLENYELTSNIDSDVNVHAVVQSYASGLLKFKSADQDTVASSLHSICWSAANISSEKISAYKMNSTNLIFARSMRNYYIIIRDEILTSNNCHRIVLDCWSDINQKIQNAFFKSEEKTQFALSLTSNKKIGEFLDEYLTNHGKTAERINTKCSMNTNREASP